MVHTGFTPEVSAMLEALLEGVRAALGDNLVGLYLRGSLVLGDFDPATSDIDFLVVTGRPIREAEFAALAGLHERLAALPNRYAKRLEGAYLDRESVERFRPGERHPTLESGSSLGQSEHRPNWVLERWAVREGGVTLVGPDPVTLVAPISEGETRAAARTRLSDWAEWAAAPDDPGWLLPRSHQTYVIETMCRALYTLERGELPSKPRAVAWALETLPEPWRFLVERSRGWRTDGTPDPVTAPEVTGFVQWAASAGERDANEPG